MGCLKVLEFVILGCVLFILLLIGFFTSYYYYDSYYIDRDNRIFMKSISPNGELTASLVNTSFMDDEGTIYIRENLKIFIMPYEMKIKVSRGGWGIWADEITWSKDSRYMGVWEGTTPRGGYDFDEKKYFKPKLEPYLIPPPKKLSSYSKSELIELFINNENKTDFLHQAIKNKDIESVKIIGQQITDWNQPDKNGLYPIHVAANSSSLEIVKYIQERGATLDLKWNGQSVLHSGAYNIEVLQYLIDQGLDVNEKNSSGMIPMHNVIHDDKYIKNIQLFLNNGADPYIKNQYDRNMYEMVWNKKYTSKMKEVFEKFKNPEEE